MRSERKVLRQKQNSLQARVCSASTSNQPPPIKLKTFEFVKMRMEQANRAQAARLNDLTIKFG